MKEDFKHLSKADLSREDLDNLTLLSYIKNATKSLSDMRVLNMPTLAELMEKSQLPPLTDILDSSILETRQSIGRLETILEKDDQANAHLFDSLLRTLHIPHVKSWKELTELLEETGKYDFQVLPSSLPSFLESDSMKKILNGLYDLDKHDQIRNHIKNVTRKKISAIESMINELTQKSLLSSVPLLRDLFYSNEAMKKIKEILGKEEFTKEDLLFYITQLTQKTKQKMRNLFENLRSTDSKLAEISDILESNILDIASIKKIRRILDIKSLGNETFHTELEEASKFDADEELADTINLASLLPNLLDNMIDTKLIKEIRQILDIKSLGKTALQMEKMVTTGGSESPSDKASANQSQLQSSLQLLLRTHSVIDTKFIKDVRRTLDERWLRRENLTVPGAAELEERLGEHLGPLEHLLLLPTMLGLVKPREDREHLATMVRAGPVLLPLLVDSAKEEVRAGGWRVCRWPAGWRAAA